MASRLTPYVQFRGEARAAMEFYQAVFGGEIASNTFADFGETDPAFSDQIMHAQLDTPAGFVLMVSDTPPGMAYSPGGAVSMILHGDDEAELRGYWDRLIEGGTVGVALEPQMWGDLYGQCTDRFGVDWMINISPAT